MAERTPSSAWADELRRRYLRGEASMFVLHGNVYDRSSTTAETLSLTDFLTDVLLKDTKDTIAVYNLATGVRFAKRAAASPAPTTLLGDAPREKVLLALERCS